MTPDEVDDALAIACIAYGNAVRTVFEKLSDDELRAIAERHGRASFDHEREWAHMAKSEIGFRYGMRRARELNARVYCFFCDGECSGNHYPKADE